MQQLTDDEFKSVYETLRAIAQARLQGRGGGRGGGTLQATAVVHDALLRISNLPPESFTDESHYLAVAAQAIRYVILDHARRRAAAGRHGLAAQLEQEAGATMQSFAPAGDVPRAELLMEINRAMADLDQHDPQLQTIVQLHVFAGLPHEEIAALLNISERTVRRRWQFAAARLRSSLAPWAKDHDGSAE